MFKVVEWITGVVASIFWAETAIVEPSTVLNTDIAVALPLAKLVPLGSAVATFVWIWSRNDTKSLCSAVRDGVFSPA